MRWFDRQLDLDPERLVFIDETWASTQHGAPLWPVSARRTPAGWRSAWPLENDDICRRTDAARLHRAAFETCVEKVLAPELREGDTVIMDNLPGHKGPRMRQLIEAAGAHLLYLPPYSPHFNPIENAFAKLKALLRKAAERTVEGLWIAIGELIDLFSHNECRNFFTAAGYDAD